MRSLLLSVCILLLGACVSTQEQTQATGSRAPVSDGAKAESKPKTSRKEKSEPAAPTEPQPNIVQIQLQNPEGGRPRTVKRPMFNITVAKSLLTLNGEPVKDLEAMRAILSRYRGLILTVAAHRCLESERAAEVLQLAQQYTEADVTYGSFGDYGDTNCD